MRLVLKLLIAVALAVAMQGLLELCAGAIDEVEFALRTYLAEMRGDPPNEPGLLDAAKQLMARQVERGKSTTQPAVVAEEKSRPRLTSATKLD